MAIAQLRWYDVNRTTSFDLGFGFAPVPVIFDGTSLWVNDGGSSNTLKKLRTGDGTALGTFPSCAGNDMAFDGANVWISCVFLGRVAKIRASDGSAILFSDESNGGGCAVDIG